ncbi:FAD-dependent oxidoreductase [Candidatus Microgenomates bacterium]|nr:FAD-dependent oxidoreductase [Candidatus Microgenomates bacterium]
MYDVIIIGSGPAGLTASIYTIRASLKTLVIAGNKPGGQLMLTTLVENYPGFPEGINGPELMQNMRKQAENLGVEFVDKDAVEIDVAKHPLAVYTKNPAEVDRSIFSGVKVAGSATGSSKIETISSQDFFQAKSLIIASGADTRWLDVPGVERLIGRGVSSCAPCDAFFFRNKNVAVVGGGDSAMEEALVLSKVAREVTIIHRRSEFRASKVMQDRVFKTANIKVVWNTLIEEVLGENNVTGLKLKTGDKIWEMPIDGIFVAIGHRPNTEKFIGKIDVDDKGYVKREEKYEQGRLKYWSATSVPGVFVGGDVHDYKYKQAVTAAAFGCIAALDVEKWLMEGD